MNTRLFSKKKYTAFFLALVLALSMAFAAPLAWADPDTNNGNNGAATASADATEGTITIDPSSFLVAANQQINLKDYVEPQGTNGEYHYDFAITEGTDVATINKHTGILTGLSEGEATVTIYLTPGLAPTQNPSNPCFPELDSVEATVAVSAALATGTYIPGETFQGLNQTLTMNTPKFNAFAVAMDSNGNVTGYTNTGATGAANSDLAFNFTMSNGTGNNFASWVTANEDNIILTTPDKTQYVYSSTSGMVLSQGNPANRNIILTIDGSILDSAGSYTLTFTSDFVAGNETSTLGADVKFVFTLS